jgi:hypothetical protein
METNNYVRFACVLKNSLPFGTRMHKAFILLTSTITLENMPASCGIYFYRKEKLTEMSSKKCLHSKSI